MTTLLRGHKACYARSHSRTHSRGSNYQNATAAATTDTDARHSVAASAQPSREPSSTRDGGSRLIQSVIGRWNIFNRPLSASSSGDSPSTTTATMTTTAASSVAASRDGLSSLTSLSRSATPATAGTALSLSTRPSLGAPAKQGSINPAGYADRRIEQDPANAPFYKVGG